MDDRTKKMQPLVIVGIPTYNSPDGLKSTLESILAQMYTNLEIIISDNASPDPQVELVIKGFQEKDSRIKYFKQEKNKDAGFNFQFVLKQATGDYFLCIRPLFNG